MNAKFMSHKLEDESQPETILCKLERAHIFSIAQDGDEFVVGEECDGYYWASLTRDELLQLSQEILQLAHNMVMK